MRITTRVAALERDHSSAPALVAQWIDMLTRLSVSLHPDGGMDHGAIREEATGYAARGIPATICDLFRMGKEAAGDEEP